MLSQKPVSKKKLAVSAAIIVFMAAGSGFMLYKNKNLVSVRNADIGIEAMKLNAESYENSPDKTDSLDLKIFSSDKFKALKENAQSGKSPAEIGKRDPFSPN